MNAYECWFQICINKTDMERKREKQTELCFNHLLLGHVLAVLTMNMTNATWFIGFGQNVLSQCLLYQIAVKLKVVITWLWLPNQRLSRPEHNQDFWLRL